MIQINQINSSFDFKMFSGALQLFLCVFLIKTTYGLDLRIVNGTDALQGEFKFAVSLKRNGRHTCGGTILNENHILTAAHCVCDDSYPRDASLFTIQFGQITLTADSTNVIQVSEIICPLFSSTLLIYDVAVLKLTIPLPSNNSDWESVRLQNHFNSSESNAGTIIGWGLLTHGGNLSESLQKLTVDIYRDDICEGHSYFRSFHHVCFGAQRAGACNGDSGTALLVDGSQVGISSFITADCGIANQTHPNVYSKIDNYYDWILDKSSGNYAQINYFLSFLALTAVIFNH